MVDRLTPERRSRLMSRVRSKNTKPELVVRRLVHAMGYRFRLHRNDLPGSPDLILPAYRTAIFVHGCFWHRHPGCRKASNPSTRVEFWTDKFQTNVARDRRNRARLRRADWRVIIVWECETRNEDLLRSILKRSLPKKKRAGDTRSRKKNRSAHRPHDPVVI
jgi:DNA mismatch endonuclease (patch repair protein)